MLPARRPDLHSDPRLSHLVLNNLKANNPAAVPLYTKALQRLRWFLRRRRAPCRSPGHDPASVAATSSVGGFGVTQPCAAIFQNTVNSLNTEWLQAAQSTTTSTRTTRSSSASRPITAFRPPAPTPSTPRSAPIAFSLRTTASSVRPPASDPRWSTS